ncbi:MAG: hypothetical protein R3B54_06895 [Bdellovibrionota bacterium]
MDKTAIEAEISAQSKVMESLSMNRELVTQIDRNIKDKEQELNDRLVHIRASVIIRHFLPPTKQGLLATQVDEKVWNSLRFVKTWCGQTATFEEISFDRATKGFGFFYTTGEVVYDLGVVEDFNGTDVYVRVVEDKRETFKVTGAPVEVKLQAFKHLQELLREISDRANNVVSKLDLLAKHQQAGQTEYLRK